MTDASESVVGPVAVILRQPDDEGYLQLVSCESRKLTISADVEGGGIPFFTPR